MRFVVISLCRGLTVIGEDQLAVDVGDTYFLFLDLILMYEAGFISDVDEHQPNVKQPEDAERENCGTWEKQSNMNKTHVEVWGLIKG